MSNNLKDIAKYNGNDWAIDGQSAKHTISYYVTCVALILHGILHVCLQSIIRSPGLQLYKLARFVPNYASIMMGIIGMSLYAGLLL